MSKRTESTTASTTGSTAESTTVPVTGSTRHGDLHPRVLGDQTRESKTKEDPKRVGPSNLLRNSMTYLERYRKFQAKMLLMRLEVFKKATIAKYGSLDKIEKTSGAPIESKTDIDIIERLCNMQTFVTLPVHDKTGTSITHFYTIGLWYYWGLPELIISFNKPIRENVDFINTITNIIHDELFHMYKDKIIQSANNTKNTNDATATALPVINRLDFDSEPETIKIILDKFDLEYDLKKVPVENYMSAKTVYMMWFYMFYMDAVNDAQGQPKMYPVYQIDIDEGQFRSACKKIIDVLMKSAVEQSSMAIPGSLETVDEDTDASDDDSEISQDIQIEQHEESDQIENLDEVECLDENDQNDSNAAYQTSSKTNNTKSANSI